MSDEPEKAVEKKGDVMPTSKFLEGSWNGWMAVLSCWCIMFNTFGYINAFGVYESYYKNTFLGNESESNIAWIGSLQVFFMFSAGIISGPMMDRYGPKVIMIPCSVLFITSGIFGGLTNGLTYTPAVTAVNQYFLRKRPLAMGIASSGSSLAGVIFPIALNRMLNKTSLGFGWTVRILGFLMLTLSITACFCVTSNAPRRKTGPPLLAKAWKAPAYYLQIIGLFLVIWALFVPFFYIPAYAQSISMTVDMSFYLIAILNAGSLFGRLVGGALANRAGRFNTLTGASLICGILILCWLSINSPGGMITFSVLFGFFSGTVIGLFPATLAMTAAAPNEIGSYMGMALGVLSFSGLTGTPITGAMINNYGTYHPAIIFAGVSSLIGGTIIFGARVCFAGSSLIA